MKTSWFPILFLFGLSGWQTSSAAAPDPALPAATQTLAQANQSTHAPIVPGLPGRAGARHAQWLYRLGKNEESAQAYLDAADTPSESESARRDFRHNAAVALFRAGTYDKAADLFGALARERPQDAADAFRNLGAALYRAAGNEADSKAEKLTERARLLKEAGEAFKETARVRSPDEAARHDLSVILAQWPNADEKARLAGLMAQHAASSPPQIAEEMLRNQRLLIQDVPAAYSNMTPSRIGLLEALSQRQRANADLWVPLKGKVLESLGQQAANDPKAQQGLAAFERLVESTRDRMRESAGLLRDLDPSSYAATVQSESGVYQVWKAVAPYAPLLQEDLRRQSNSVERTTSARAHPESPAVEALKPDLREAPELTRLFSQRFAEAVPEQGQETTASSPVSVQGTNAVPPAGTSTNTISPETRRKILELADQAATSQDSALSSAEKKDLDQSLVHQTKGLQILNEIEKLLPKEPPKDSKNSQEPQNSSDQQKPQPQQDNKPEPPKESEKPEEPPPAPEPKPEEKQPEQAESSPDEKPSQDEARRILEKALEREKEHEAEKRRRATDIPPSAIDRDW